MEMVYYLIYLNDNNEYKIGIIIMKISNMNNNNYL